MNEVIDKKIVEAIKAGKNRFHKLGTSIADFRKIDRRLQALRKRGVLKYDSKAGWSVQSNSQ